MSISGSLSNALSGLSIASRKAELVSANVANASTPGYGRRVLTVTGSVVGGIGHGARAYGVERVVNQTAITDRRLAEAALGLSLTQANFFDGFERAIGEPSDPTSLGSRFASFEAALIAAGASPDSEARLRAVADTAQAIVTGINGLADHIASARQGADQDIAHQVTRLNDALQGVHLLNQQILRQGQTGAEVASLIDERQFLIDGISDLVAVRELPQEDGRIVLMTETGATLVGERPAEISFSATPLVQPYMTRENGLLSGLEITGSSSTPGNAHLALSGGRLEALFDLRDVEAVEAQARVDGLARELVSRFEDPNVDPSVVAGMAGLFTDDGLPFDALSEVGLAGRLSLNTAVLPEEGGSLAKFRDGLYGAPASEGDASILTAMSDALQDVRLPASGGFQNAGSLSALTGSLLSNASQSKLSAQSRQAFATAQTNALAELEAQSAVDTDQEMQTLLLIEQLYAANAKVIESADDMLQQILRL